MVPLVVPEKVFVTDVTKLPDSASPSGGTVPPGASGVPNAIDEVAIKPKTATPARIQFLMISPVRKVAKMTIFVLAYRYDYFFNGAKGGAVDRPFFPVIISAGREQIRNKWLNWQLESHEIADANSLSAGASCNDGKVSLSRVNSV
jgi:hypothetical protein